MLVSVAHSDVVFNLIVGVILENITTALWKLCEGQPTCIGVLACVSRIDILCSTEGFPLASLKSTSSLPPSRTCTDERDLDIARQFSKSRYLERHLGTAKDIWHSINSIH